jgi:hypothetical protein
MNASESQLLEEERAAQAKLAAAKKVARRALIQNVIAKEQLDKAIRETADIVSRRRAAEITDLTPGRIQQIINGETGPKRKVRVKIPAKAKH